MLAVPNISEGRDLKIIAAAEQALAEHVKLLNSHQDRDHNRSVFSITGTPQGLLAGLCALAKITVSRIDLTSQYGVHPHVGALDVAPIVYLDKAERGLACATALTLGEELGMLGIPIFLYGSLAHGRTRAELRRGGGTCLRKRVVAGELKPDFGPTTVDKRHGATLVSARPPLVAFNLELAPDVQEETARQVAATVREGGVAGLSGVRALALRLPEQDKLQLSFNVEDPITVPLAQLIEAVRAYVEVTAGELVGLAPRAALVGFPSDLPLPGFLPEKHLIENALSLASSNRS